MRSSKHIVWLVPGFATHEEDYWCLPPVQGLALAFQARYPEHRLRILAVHYPYERKSYQWHGIPVTTLGGNNRRFPWKIGTWRACLRQLRVWHKEQAIDHLHSFWLNETAWLGSRFAARSGVPHLCTAMGQDALRSNAYLRRLSLDKLEVVCISERQKAALQQSCGKVAREVIPWGADGMIQQTEKEDFEQKIDILGVGSLVEVKNYRLFLEVIRELKNTFPRIRAQVIGPGKQKEDLEKLAAQWGLEQQVQFSGYQDRPEILQTMAQSRIFLHTANYEGQGYCFLEAASRGLPIVSTPVGMAHESENWKLGKSAKELAAACEHFLKKSDLCPPSLQGSIEDSLASYGKLYRL